ncbi:alpha/beta-hydrolase, partial [Conidiobolus coronatus NRRL 28638]
GTKVTIGIEPSTKEIIISHRGSQNLQNWIMDFNFNKAKLPNSPEGTLVHEGFLNMYQSLASQINSYLMNMLDSREYRGYKVVITGQSLGGALATIHIVDIASMIKNKGIEIELYTYHSPRVGNQEFVNHAVSLDFPTARYTNRADIFSHLAPRSWGYVHIPVEFHTNFNDIASNSFHECSQDYDEDPNC